MSDKNLYFDTAATTPINPEVANLIHEINLEHYGNPSSIHSQGQKSHNIIERSRTEIANILGCSVSELYFTSGGSESNNIVLSKLMDKDEEFSYALKLNYNITAGNAGNILVLIDQDVRGKIGKYGDILDSFILYKDFTN